LNAHAPTPPLAGALTDYHLALQLRSPDWPALLLSAGCAGEPVFAKCWDGGLRQRVLAAGVLGAEGHGGRGLRSSCPPGVQGSRCLPSAGTVGCAGACLPRVCWGL